MSDRMKGFSNEWDCLRYDGTDGPGGKHEKCETFVLDLVHDQFAIPALRAYIEACRDEYPVLAEDLEKKLP